MNVIIHIWNGQIYHRSILRPFLPFPALMTWGWGHHCWWTYRLWNWTEETNWCPNNTLMAYPWNTWINTLLAYILLFHQEWINVELTLSSCSWRVPIYYLLWQERKGRRNKCSPILYPITTELTLIEPVWNAVIYKGRVSGWRQRHVLLVCRGLPQIDVVIYNYNKGRCVPHPRRVLQSPSGRGRF